MRMSPLLLALLITFTSAQALPDARGHRRHPLLKSETFLSPAVSLRPGSVSNKWYMDVAFPRGHLALKSFDAELVDAAGAPVPLHETYLHHFLVQPYYTSTAARGATVDGVNAGVCGAPLLRQYFGLGAETRRTATWVPDPYAVEVGAPPEGYEERWSLNVHAIDTRGAADAHGCAECRCDLYNVTAAVGDDDGYYPGGLLCCVDQARCRLQEGFAAAAAGDEPRELFLRYTVMWLDWSDAAAVPVRIYILDVADRALLEGKSEPDCKGEYQVAECSPEKRARDACVDVQVSEEALPRGGDIVFAVGHQHAAGVGISLHGEDGRLLCRSVSTYGDGEEAGNEAGYIVGMSACYPEPGGAASRVRGGEALTVVSNYSSERRHTGVMGHFYLLVADEQPEQQKKKAEANNKKQQPSSLCFSFPVPWCIPAWIWSVEHPSM